MVWKPKHLRGKMIDYGMKSFQTCFWAPGESFGMPFCICLDITISSNLLYKKMKIIYFFLYFLINSNYSLIVHECSAHDCRQTVTSPVSIARDHLELMLEPSKDDNTGSWSKVAWTRNPWASKELLISS